MSRIRIVVLVFAVLTAFGQTLAAGVEFVLTDGTGELSGGEVCFFHSSAVAKDVAPDRLYFSSRDVRCFPANTVLDMPAGLLMIFARHPDGYVSSSRNLQYAAQPSGPGCYQKVDISVVPSASLDFTDAGIDSQSYVGVWVGDTDASLGTFLPAVPGENMIQVPAGIPLIPLEISDNRPKRIGEILTLRVGERLQVKFPAATKRGDVVGWLRGSDDVVRDLTKKHRVLDDPRIVLVDSAGRNVLPQIRLRHPGSFNGSLVFFRDVLPGNATISVSGTLWKSESITVNVASAAVTVPENGLEVLPAAAVRVVLPPEFAMLTPTDCDQQRTAIKASLRKCPSAPEALENHPPLCTVYREVDADGSISVVEFPGIPQGAYDVEVAMQNQLLAHQSVTAVVGQDMEIRIEQVGTIAYGTVRRGQSPIHAELTFATGDRVTSTSGGDFRTLLKGNPGTQPIAIRTCEGNRRYVYLPTDVPSPYAPLEIEIAQNALVVTVHDAATGKPLAASRVKYAVLAESDDTDTNTESFSALYSQSAAADNSGMSRFEGVVANRPLRVCASAADHRPACTRTLTMTRNGERRVQIDLRSNKSLVGRFIAPTKPDGTTLFLLSLDGHLISQARVGSDGTFQYEATGLAEGFAVIVSPSLPLSVARFAADANKDVSIVVKTEATSGRRFTVEVAPREQPLTARIGLRLDGVLIPANAFGDHQGARGLQSVLMNGKPLEVVDIAAARELVVILGPDPRDRSFPPDAVGRPEYAAAFRAHILQPGEQAVHFE